ncbi:serine/threonine protein kinase [Streptomyces venezuelae]|uniref:Serine/threonine protein kinase n=1 Tax=Streptomyces venezuelae TaxID=54571 RepID=A0A5P2D1J3_STRVZ|nr:serine/threonine-protein kinase [Streptomyces venezuelae]QES48985.1 serine/threonine protein kinase [Streptomyces venezuelae]
MEALRDTDPTQIGAHALLARLGAGGMGQVYLARSPGGRLVAVKVIRDEITGHPEALARFRREAETVRAVRSAYTANLIDASLAAPPFWLATEYVAGPTLGHAVAQRGALPAETCRKLFAALAEGLASVHAYGVTHRDLKPQNVILGAQGPQLIDFGIAKGTTQTALTALTQDGAAPGTPGYTAPEVLLRNEVADAADVFALGATIAYAATGRAPYGTGESAGVSFRAVHGEIDVAGVEPELAALIEACVAKDPADRPAPAEVIRRCAVDSALVDDPVYAGLTATGEAPQFPAQATAPAGPAGAAGAYSPTYVPTYAVAGAPTYIPAPPMPPAPPTARRRLSRWAIAGIAAMLVLPGAVGGYLLLQNERDKKDGGDTRSQNTASPGTPAQSTPSAKGPASSGSGKPAEYIENNRISRYFWTGDADSQLAAAGVGRCNLGTEEKPPGADMQTFMATSGQKTKISMRIKYAETEPTKPGPYYVSVGVRSPHEVDSETGLPLPMENKSVGYTSKPVDIYSKWPSGEFLELTYPDDFKTHVEGRTWQPIPLRNDPGEWTVVFYHVNDDPTKYSSIACSGFRVS